MGNTIGREGADLLFLEKLSSRPIGWTSNVTGYTLHDKWRRSARLNGKSGGWLFVLYRQSSIGYEVMLLSNASSNVRDALNDIRYWSTDESPWNNVPGRTTRGFRDAQLAQWETRGHTSLIDALNANPPPIAGSAFNVYCVGHSLGGAIACLNAVQLYDETADGKTLYPASTYIPLDNRNVTYGCPLWADKELGVSYNTLVSPPASHSYDVETTVHYVNTMWTPTSSRRDIVPSLPPFGISTSTAGGVTKQVKSSRGMYMQYARMLGYTGKLAQLRFGARTSLTGMWMAHQSPAYLIRSRRENLTTSERNALTSVR